MLLIHLFIAIAIMVVIIAYFKLDAPIGLIGGALYLGIASGMPAPEVVNTISSGFGGLMTGIGIPIALGVMIGKLLADTGGVESIARGFTKNIKNPDNTPYAMLGTGFISSIPVYYDVVYVIVAPLARGLSKVSKRPYPLFIGALVAGASVAHCFVLPTPGPLAGAEILGIPLGIMFIVGGLIGLITALISYSIYKQIITRCPKFWNPEKDEEVETIEENKNEDKLEKYPSFILAVLPILIPIILILSGTVAGLIYETVPTFIQFLSHRIVAMLVGVIVAFAIASKYIGKDKASKSVRAAIGMTGVIILVTGTGGSLGAVIRAAGVGDVLVDVMSTWSISPIIFVWLVAALIGGAQGSGTVAMITAASLVAPNIAEMGVAPIYIAMAAFSGAPAFRWINDSGFWVSTLIAKLKISGGFKTYSVVCLIVSVISLLVTLLLSVVWVSPFGM